MDAGLCGNICCKMPTFSAQMLTCVFTQIHHHCISEAILLLRKTTLLNKPWQIVLIGRHGEEVGALGLLPDAIYCPAHNRLMAHWLETGSKKWLLLLMSTVCEEEEVERGRAEKVKIEKEGERGEKLRSNTDRWGGGGRQME